MKFSALPLPYIALWASILSGAWELVQCTLFFDMWGWGLWTNILWMSAATAIDLVLVLGVIWLASRIAGAAQIRRPSRSGTAVLVLVGGLAGAIIEWVAGAMHLWTYSKRMPTMTLFKASIGLTPVLQMALLPLISVLLATGSGRDVSRRGGPV
jgi:hypothetical protein